MDVLTVKPTTQNTKKSLIRAAAWALMQDPRVCIDLAGLDTVSFINGCRKAYKAYGFKFSDADIRQIHYLIRENVAELGKQGLLPVLDRIGPTTFRMRPKPEVLVTTPERETRVYGKTDKVE